MTNFTFKQTKGISTEVVYGNRDVHLSSEPKIHFIHIQTSTYNSTNSECKLLDQNHIYNALLTRVHQTRDTQKSEKLECTYVCMFIICNNITRVKPLLSVPIFFVHT